jgi:uncharacterized delta-60 repeat protein
VILPATIKDEAQGLTFVNGNNLLITGSTLQPVSSTNARTFKLLANGIVDSTWAQSGALEWDFSNGYDTNKCAAALPAGSAYIGGQTLRYYGLSSGAVISRLQANGSLDATFGSGGRLFLNIGTSTFLSAMKLAPDGSLFAAGHVDLTSDTDFWLAKFSPVGQWDATLGNSGYIVTDVEAHAVDHVSSIEIQDDGKILVAGTWNRGSTYDVAVVRYLPNGALDPSWHGTGRVVTDMGNDAYDVGTSIVVQSNGNVVVAVTTNLAQDHTLFGLVGYLPNGEINTSFGTGGKVTTDWGGAAQTATLLRLGDDRLILAGSADIAAVQQAVVARYLANGTPDASWGSNGKVSTLLAAGTDFRVNTAALDANHALVLAGTASTNMSTKMAAVRYLSGPVAPDVITGAVTNLGHRSVILTGQVQTTLPATSGKFDYGLTSSYGNIAALTTIPTGSTPQAVSAAITNLEPNTLYHYRISSSNSAGTAVGFERTFTTTRSPVELSITRSNGTALTDAGPSLNLGFAALGQPVSDVLTIKNISSRTIGNLNLVIDDLSPSPLSIGALAATTLAPNAVTTMNVSFTPQYGGTVTRTFHLLTTNEEDNPFDLTVEGYAESQIDTQWRVQWFGTSNNAGDAADLADPNHNGIPNLLEYALGTNPVVPDPSSASALPSAVLDRTTSRLQFKCSRQLSTTDLRITVQGSANLSGDWENLARSIGGQPFLGLVGNVNVTETGTGNTRQVIISQPLSTVSNHRFMRLEVKRQ